MLFKMWDMYTDAIVNITVYNSAYIFEYIFWTLGYARES